MIDQGPEKRPFFSRRPPYNEEKRPRFWGKWWKRWLFEQGLRIQFQDIKDITICPFLIATNFCVLYQTAQYFNGATLDEQSRKLTHWERLAETEGAILQNQNCLWLAAAQTHRSPAFAKKKLEFGQNARTDVAKHKNCPWLWNCESWSLEKNRMSGKKVIRK